MLNNMFNEAGSLPCQAGTRGPGWDESRTPGMRKGRKGAASVSKGDGRRAAGDGPKGFSFEASLMILPGSRPSSRARSSTGLPGS
jgi:hypothetical protein